jgi:hypothetical protein
MADGDATMLQELSGYQLGFEDCQKLLKVRQKSLRQ